MSGIVIYWVVGVLLCLMAVDRNMVDEIRRFCNIDLIPNGENVFRGVLFISICVAAFFWPVMILLSFIRAIK